MCDGLVVVFTWAYFRRLWCVYEWACFLVFHDPVDLILSTETAYRASTEDRTPFHLGPLDLDPVALSRTVLGLCMSFGWQHLGDEGIRCEALAATIVATCTICDFVRLSALQSCAACLILEAHVVIAVSGCLLSGRWVAHSS